MKDLRNDLARARDEWLGSPDGRSFRLGTTHGMYLENRLVSAFIAGWNAAEKRQKELEAARLSTEGTKHD